MFPRRVLRWRESFSMASLALPVFGGVFEVEAKRSHATKSMDPVGLYEVS